jgi:acetyl-CoA synthetase
MMIAPVSGRVPAKPAGNVPVPGIIVDVVDRTGKSVGGDDGGFLVVKRPWPSMMRTIYGDPESLQETDWSDIEGVNFTGTARDATEDGLHLDMGRTIRHMSPAHRIGTMEVESALVSHLIQ